MNKITVNDVKEYNLEFKDWRTGKGCYVSITEWSNGEGYALSFQEGGNDFSVNVTREMLDAITALYHYSNIYFGKEKQ